MSWFTKVETKNVETLAQPTPQAQFEENRAELAKLGQELAAAEKAIRSHIGVGKDPRVMFLNRDGHLSMYARRNAMFFDPVLQKLESNLRAVLGKRAAALDAHARLKKELGLGIY